MFPILLDDQSLFTEFENFIEAVDNMHELALGGQQQFPVFCWFTCLPCSSLAFNYFCTFFSLK